MSDLLLALAYVAAGSVCLFLVSRQIGRRHGLSIRNLLAVGTMLLGTGYFCFLWDQVLLSRVVPHSSLVVLGNWFPMFAGVLCGVAWTSRLSVLRRSIAVSSLGIAALAILISPLTGTSPTCGDQWRDGVCIQTTKHTCSPASAATLLRKYGIEATESEMSNLCLTREGTTWQGLYRGLSLKTHGTPWDVEVFEGTFDDLRSTDAAPAILVARLPVERRSDSQFTDTSGWIPGQSHSVVFSHFLNDHTVVMNDPSFGREIWRVEDLKTLWTGRAIRLVPRSQESTLVGILRAAL